MKDSTHKVKYSKSNDTYQVWLGDEIVTDFATKERADAEAKRLNALQDAKNIDKAQVEEGAKEEGEMAASKGKKYDENPYKKGTQDYLDWSKGHNSSRARKLDMNEENIKESTINEVKEMTFGAYLDDLDNRFVDLMKAAKGLNAEGSQEIDMRATINQNFTLFRNYISALKKEYRDELNKELTFSINETVNEASKGAMNYFSDLKFNYQKAFRYLDVEEREEYKRLVKDFFSKLQVDDKVRAVGKVNEQMDIYDDIANEEFGMDYDQLGSGEKEWVRDEIDNMSINEAKKDIYDKFLENPTSPKGRAKAIISKFKKKYGEDATEMAVDRFSKQNNLKPEEKYILKYITKNDIKITSQPGGPNLSVVNEAKATCCHRCGRVHVKGSGCKKPYLKGKDSCAVKEVQDLQERLDSLKETKSAPKGHYFTKSGNLVKGRMTKDAEERGARKSDPKDKMRSKIPKVTQYTETVKEYMKKRPNMKKSEMMEAIKDIIKTNN